MKVKDFMLLSLVVSALVVAVLADTSFKDQEKVDAGEKTKVEDAKYTGGCRYGHCCHWGRHGCIKYCEDYAKLAATKETDQDKVDDVQPQGGGHGGWGGGGGGGHEDWGGGGGGHRGWGGGGGGHGGGGHGGGGHGGGGGKTDEASEKKNSEPKT